MIQEDVTLLSVGPETTEFQAEIVPAAKQRLRGLMICSLFTLAYRALRCFTAAEVDVYVLGNRRSRGMRYSRHCAFYTETEHRFDGSCDAAMIDAVNAAILRHRIDFVYAGDHTATRSLIAMGGQLRARCFPMPDLVTFDLLNNKARFTELCRKLDILCPPTRVFDDRKALLGQIAAGAITLPAIVKPLALDGNRGVIEIATAAAANEAPIDYRPILVQRFIEGCDIGASVYADRGRVVAYICHRLRRATYTTLDDRTVLASLTRIVAETGVSGVLNFDMRLAPDGRVFFLECNPRMFYKITLSMLLGVNFASFGLAAMTGDTAGALPAAAAVAMPQAGDAVRSLKAIVATVPTPWRITRRDRAMLNYILSDPLPYIRQNLRIEWEDRSY